MISKFSSFLAIVLLAAKQSQAVAAGASINPSCSTNSCLRTVIANHHPSGQPGCAAFFKTTVIPATSTVKTTTSSPVTITRTVTSVTSVSTDYAGTTTSTASDTTSATTTVTITSTVTVSSTTTLPYSPTDASDGRISKRAGKNKPTTVSATAVPSYASNVCTNSAQYSSACSCIGATQTVTTLSTPVETKTITKHPVTVTRTTVQTVSVTNDPGTTTVYTTTTVTSTTTITTSETDSVTQTFTTTSPSPTCGNLGFQWAFYGNYNGDGHPPYSNFEPANYKTQTPDYNDTYNDGTFGGFIIPSSQSPTSIYNSSQQFNNQEFVLNQRGYFYAALTGLYYINATNVDDLIDLWFDGSAYSGYARDNAYFETYYGEFDEYGHDYSQTGAGRGLISLQVNSPAYIPWRIFFLQSYSGASFTLDISDPFGNPVTDIIQFGCLDSDEAPPFPPFGSET